MDVNGLSNIVIGCCIDIHRELGAGLLESAYEACLCHELSVRNIAFERQKQIGIMYKGMAIDAGFRADMVVEDCLILELKSVEKLLPIHDAQLLSYMKLGGWNLGLLLNFNVKFMKQGIRRRVLELKE